MINKISKVEVKDNKYIITSIQPNGDKLITECNKDEYDKMFNLLKQAKLVSGNAIIESDEDIELKTIDNKLDEFKDDVLEEVEFKLEHMKKDYEFLKGFINEVVYKKNLLFEELNTESNTKLEMLGQTLQNIKMMNVTALESLSTKEENMNKIIQNLKKKSKITFEELQDSSDELYASKVEYEKFKDMAKNEVAKLETFRARSDEKLNSISDVLDDLIKDYKVNLSNVNKRYRETVNEAKKKLYENKENELKQAYIDREVKRNEKLKEDKIRYINITMDHIAKLAEQNKISINDIVNKAISKFSDDMNRLLIHKTSEEKLSRLVIKFEKLVGRIAEQQLKNKIKNEEYTNKKINFGLIKIKIADKIKSLTEKKG